MQTPSRTSLTIASAASSGSTYNIDMRGVDRASLQLHATLSSSNTDVVTLKMSNDNSVYVGFATAKTVTFTGGGTLDAIFDLGDINYAYLQVAFATPSGGTVSLTGSLYAVPTTVRISN